MNKKLFVTAQQKKSCKLELSDHLWIPFIYQPWSYIVVFSIINVRIYKILVKKWKHGIGPNYIIRFNGELEFVST